jgi:hypothetical protein
MQSPGDQAALPPPVAIRDAAHEVLSRSYYELTAAPRRDATPFLFRLIEWLLAPFRWLYESMEDWPELVRWIVVVLSVLVCAALIAHIIYTFVAAIRGPVKRRSLLQFSPPRELDPAELESQAEQAGTRGDYIGAIRLLFRAALRRIESREKKRLRPGSTNREILRRYRATPLAQSLERLVETIDQKWYGSEACSEQDYLICRTEAARIQSYVEGSRPVVGT